MSATSGRHPSRRQADVERQPETQEDPNEGGLRESIIFRSDEYEGPVPPPALIAGYQQAVPGGGERVLAFAESEQKHRHALENRSMRYSASAHILGQVMAFALSLTITVFGYELLRNGQSVAGYATLLVGGGSLLRATFRGSKR
jgi:uncharacterized membrane protein